MSWMGGWVSRSHAVTLTIENRHPSSVVDRRAVDPHFAHSFCLYLYLHDDEDDYIFGHCLLYTYQLIVAEQHIYISLLQ